MKMHEVLKPKTTKNFINYDYIRCRVCGSRLKSLLATPEACYYYERHYCSKLCNDFDDNMSFEEYSYILDYPDVEP